MKDKLLNKLDNHPWVGNLHWFDTIGSTNTEAKKLGLNGAPHGTVLIADQQTGGRGRMGRSFCSPAGSGIYMSVILRPDCAATELMHLTCAVAVAMCNAVQRCTGFRPGVKWINDLLAKGKKLGGILTELSLIPGTDRVDFAVVGVGINCTQKPQDFPPELQDIAISLETATGIAPDRAGLAAAMIEALQVMSVQLLTEKASIMTQYQQDCTTIGQDIYLLKGEERLPCHAISVDSDGALLVRFPDGRESAVSSGEVSVRPQ